MSAICTLTRENKTNLSANSILSSINPNILSSVEPSKAKAVLECVSTFWNYISAPIIISSTSTYNNDTTHTFEWSVQSVSTESNRVFIAVAKLDEIRLLQPNWDSYGANAFASSFIDQVESLVRRLPHIPSIFPTGRGSIQFEYDYNGNYLEVEIYENGDITYYKELSNGDYEENEIYSYDEIVKAVEKFYEV